MLLDGVPLRSLHPGWLRKQAGLVSQEPVLFQARWRMGGEGGRTMSPVHTPPSPARAQDSIAYNIAYGGEPKGLPDLGMSANPEDGADMPPGFSVPEAVER